MKITTSNSPTPKTNLPHPRHLPDAGPTDRYEPSPVPKPPWKQCLTASLVTGTATGLLSGVGALLGPNSAAPAITGGLAGCLGFAAGKSQVSTDEGVYGGLVIGGMTALATVPGMLYGYQGALMAAGGGAVLGALSCILTKLDNG